MTYKNEKIFINRYYFIFKIRFLTNVFLSLISYNAESYSIVLFTRKLES